MNPYYLSVLHFNQTRILESAFIIKSRSFVLNSIISSRVNDEKLFYYAQFTIHLFFHQQLGRGLSPQSCLYFQGFGGSKLLNSCLVVWPSNLCLRGIRQFSGFKFNIYDQCFKNFPNNAFETAEFWCIADLTAISHLLHRNTPLFVNLQFLLFLVKDGLRG